MPTAPAPLLPHLLSGAAEKPLPSIHSQVVPSSEQPEQTRTPRPSRPPAGCGLCSPWAGFPAVAGLKHDMSTQPHFGVRKPERRWDFPRTTAGGEFPGIPRRGHHGDAGAFCGSAWRRWTQPGLHGEALSARFCLQPSGHDVVGGGTENPRQVQLRAEAVFSREIKPATVWEQ